jgi:Disulphide bond corrector protein DsbC
VGQNPPAFASRDQFGHEQSIETLKGSNGTALLFFRSAEASGIELAPVTYPVSKDLFLEAIQEHVPVFEGKFRIIQDVTIDFSPASDIVRSLVSEGKTISISGELRYQACDKTVCYPPTSLPVMWSLKVFRLDLNRSPEAIRHQ